MSSLGLLEYVPFQELLPLTSSNSFPSRSRLPSTFSHSCLQRRQRDTTFTACERTYRTPLCLLTDDPPLTASPPAQRPQKKHQTSDAFVFDTVGDASLLKSLGGSGQDVHGDAESDDAPARKNSSSNVTRVVVEPITFEGLELDASCFSRTCLLALAALAGVKPQVIDDHVPCCSSQSHASGRRPLG